MVEIDIPEPYFLHTRCELRTTSVMNARPPLISIVCRESRQVALRHGWPLRNHMKLVAGFQEWRGSDDRRDQWACPETDIIHTHFYSHHDGSFDRDVWTYIQNAASITQGACVSTEVIYAFKEPPVNLRYNPVFRRLKRLDTYYVCIRMISIHIPSEKALQTNLFGINGEEFMKCVDAYATTNYQALAALVPEGDVQARELVDLLSSLDFPSLVKNWEERVAKTWLFTKWLDAMQRPDPPSRGRLTYLNELVAPHSEFGTVWTSTPDDNAVSSLGYWGERNPDYYTIVEDNAWVKEVVKSRPKFRPVVMFRLCPDNC